MAGLPPDLHPDDRQNRLTLRTHLIEARKQRGWTQKDLGNAIGRYPTSIDRFEHTDQWFMGSVQAWARGVGGTVVLEPVGFPAPHLHARDEVDSTMALLASLARPTDPVRADQWQVNSLRTHLVGVRAALGLSRLALCPVLAVSQQAIFDFEEGEHDSRLAAFQRYARALATVTGRRDAFLSVRFDRIP